MTRSGMLQKRTIENDDDDDEEEEEEEEEVGIISNTESDNVETNNADSDKSSSRQNGSQNGSGSRKRKRGEVSNKATIEYRRKLRKRIVKAGERIDLEKEELTNPESTKLTSCAKETTEISLKIRHIREANVDYKTYVKFGGITDEICEKIYSSSTLCWNSDDFYEKAENQFQDSSGNINLHKLGSLFSDVFSRTSSVGFVNGVMRTEEKVKERKKAVRGSFEKDALKVKSLKHKDNSEDITQQQIKNVYREIKEINQQDFFTYCINENSFSKSVERIFYTSFLVKDDKLKIDIKDEGSGAYPPTISFVKDEVDDKAPKMQFIMKLDYNMYNKLVNYKKNEDSEDDENEDESPNN